MKKRLRRFAFPENTKKVILMRNPNKITLGTVEKKAVILITDPS
jgi:hypothetical protein